MKTDKLKMIMAMAIFGTIGIFRRYIPISSALLALCRGIIGSIFLFLMMRIRKEKFARDTFRQYGVLLVLSGAFIGFNWIFLFESYNYTSIATATLCYYMAPIFVMIISPFLAKEKHTMKSMICIVTAFIGMLLISGIFTASRGSNDLKGIIYGLLAALLYASVILLNQHLKDLDANIKTILQLASASVVLLPYVVFTGIDISSFTLITCLMILIVGIIHTGIAYTLYFASMKSLPLQSIALFSYIDPLLAIALSAGFLHEAISIYEIIGAVLILGATLYNELSTNS